MSLRQRVKQLESDNKQLKEQQTSILEQLGELKEAMAKKKYISETTSKDDEPVPFAKVMDEYFNGENGDGK